MKTTRINSSSVRKEVQTRKFQDFQARTKRAPMMEDTTRNAILFFSLVTVLGIVLYAFGFVTLY